MMNKFPHVPTNWKIAVLVLLSTLKSNRKTYFLFIFMYSIFEKIHFHPDNSSTLSLFFKLSIMLFDCYYVFIRLYKRNFRTYKILSGRATTRIYAFAFYREQSANLFSSENGSILVRKTTE